MKVGRDSIKISSRDVDAGGRYMNEVRNRSTFKLGNQGNLEKTFSSALFWCILAKKSDLNIYVIII